MNVPELMLAALNLIIVQKRIHDRRKGTVRRVTEVAEVTGVLEGNPQLIYLFEWDAATDTIKSTGVPSKFLQELGRYTGASHVQIQDEIRKRKEFLDKLVASGTRDIKSVCDELQSYKG
jgi:flagellar protein FlaI